MLGRRIVNADQSAARGSEPEAALVISENVRDTSRRLPILCIEESECAIAEARQPGAKTDPDVP